MIEHAIKYLPDLVDDFKFDPVDKDSRACLAFHGGEDAALERLKEFIKSGLFSYKKRRNELMGADFSSKLSPWLANGSLSVRQVYHAIKQLEA